MYKIMINNEELLLEDAFFQLLEQGLIKKSYLKKLPSFNHDISGFSNISLGFQRRKTAHSILNRSDLTIMLLESTPKGQRNLYTPYIEYIVNNIQLPEDGAKNAGLISYDCIKDFNLYTQDYSTSLSQNKLLELIAYLKSYGPIHGLGCTSVDEYQKLLFMKELPSFCFFKTAILNVVEKCEQISSLNPDLGLPATPKLICQLIGPTGPLDNRFYNLEELLYD